MSRSTASEAVSEGASTCHRVLDMAITGIHKSGTSSLFGWLDAHPRLQGSVPKETFFFMDADHPLCGRHGVSYRVDGIETYQRFFSADQGERLRFEGTTHYFYQTEARDFLTSLSPQPVIVMVLREPAARLLSSFRFTRDNLANCDRALSFDRYVSCLLEDDLEELDFWYHAPSSLYIAKRELELSRYAHWLDWWLERLDRDRLEIVLFEELKTDSLTIVKRLCNRIGIDPAAYDDFDFGPRNPTFPIGVQSLHRVARQIGARLPAGRFRERLKRYYLKWQAGVAAPEEGYRWGMEALRTVLGPWNRRLARDFDLDLARWWGPAARLDEGNGSDRAE